MNRLPFKSKKREVLLLLLLLLPVLLQLHAILIIISVIGLSDKIAKGCVSQIQLLLKCISATIVKIIST